MRIGIDARMYGSGFTGIGRYTYELLRYLAEIDSVNEYVVFLRKDGFEAYQPPNERFSKRLADFQHYSFAEQLKFPGLIKAEKLDLMHFCHFNAPLFYRGPFIVTIHDLTLSFYPGKKMNNAFRRAAYQLVLRSVTKRAKAIVAVSNNTKKDLEQVLKIPSEKISVVYNGVNPEFGEKSSTSKADLMKKLNLEKPYFLYTGVWRDHKNLVGMIRAFAQMNREFQQYSLVITGRHNPTYHEVPDTVKELGLEDSVHLVGMVPDEDLRALYQNALAYIFPSFYEGFGLPPLEAMQSGTPVMASNRSSIPEVCGEGNALFFDPEIVEEMAERMRSLAIDASLRQRLVDRGFERVKAFDWKKMAEEVLRVYNSIKN